MVLQSRDAVDDLPLTNGGTTPRVVVPAAFYRDDEPPEPPEDDPHWQEFPLFESMKGSRLLVVGIVAGVVFATVVHLLIIVTL